MIDVEQTLNRKFYIHELAHMKNRLIYQGDFSTNKSLVRTPFLVGHAMGLHHGTRINGVLKLLKIRFNLQTG